MSRYRLSVSVVFLSSLGMRNIDEVRCNYDADKIYSDPRLFYFDVTLFFVLSG